MYKFQAMKKALPDEKKPAEHNYTQPSLADYNPNVWLPRGDHLRYKEFLKRLEACIELQRITKSRLVYSDRTDYSYQDWLKMGKPMEPHQIPEDMLYDNNHMSYLQPCNKLFK